jgi:hypothetical protein
MTKDEQEEVLKQALEDWRQDLADPDHVDNDWSEKVCISRVRVALTGGTPWRLKRSTS